MAVQDVESPRWKRVDRPQESAPLQQLKRAKRTPGGDAYVDNKQHFREFINSLIVNDPSLGTLNGRVLRVKNYVSPDASPAQMDMVIECLKHNVRIEVLYIQNFEKGFGDKQLESLTDVLRQKRIWAVNIGENLGVSIEAWHQFAKAMPETVVSYMYISEHKLKGTDLKHHMRTVMRYNRKILGPRDPYLCSMVHNMWYNPAPSQCDINAPDYERDGLNRAYATEEEVLRRHQEDVRRIEGRRAALSAVGMPTPSIPPNPEHPEPTVEILKMFVFEDSHLFPPRLKLVAHPRTGREAQLILPEEVVQPAEHQQVRPQRQRSLSATVPGSASASGGNVPARGSTFGTVMQQGHRGDRDDCRSFMPLRKPLGRVKVPRPRIALGKAAQHQGNCTPCSSRSTSLAISGSHTSGQSATTVHWPLFHTLVQGRSTPRAARAAQSQAPQAPVLQPRRKRSKGRAASLSRQASQDMMTTRRAAASSSAVSSPRRALSSPRYAASSQRHAASSPRHAEVASVTGARMANRCISHQWASARLKIIQDEAREAAAVAAAEAAAEKKARAAEAAANPQPPAPVAEAAPPVEAPQPQRLQFVTVLPDVLGKRWKPGDPVPSQAQIDAASQLGDNRRRIRVRPLSDCGLDGKGPPVQHRPAPKRLAGKRATDGTRPESMAAHSHDAALPVAHPCVNNGELNASLHGNMSNQTAQHAALAFGAAAGSKSSCQSTHAWAGAYMPPTGPPHHLPVMPLANANVECGTMAPWIDPGQQLQHVHVLQAYNAIHTQGNPQPWGAGVSNCGERRSGSGYRGSDLSADGSAGSAMSMLTQFSNGASAGMLPQYHPLQHVENLNNVGAPNGQANGMQPGDAAQRGTVNLNPGKPLLIHAFRASMSTPPQQHQLAPRAQQDFGLWGTDHAPGKRIPRVPHVGTRPTRASFGLMITKRMQLFKQQCAEADHQRSADERERMRHLEDGSNDASDGESQDMREDDVSSEAGSGLVGCADDASSSSAADSEYDSLTSDEEDEEWDVAEVLEESAVNVEKEKPVRLSKPGHAEERMQRSTCRGEHAEQRAACPIGGGATQSSASAGQTVECSGWGAISPLEIVPGMAPVAACAPVQAVGVRSNKVLDIEFVEPLGEADTSSSEDDDDCADVQQSCDAAEPESDDELWHTLGTGRPCTLGISVVERPSAGAQAGVPDLDGHSAQEITVPPNFAPATPARAPGTPARTPITPVKAPAPNAGCIHAKPACMAAPAAARAPSSVSPLASHGKFEKAAPPAASSARQMAARSSWPPRVVPWTGNTPYRPEGTADTRALQQGGACAAPCQPVKGTVPADAHFANRTSSGAAPVACSAANKSAVSPPAVLTHKGLAVSGLQSKAVQATPVQCKVAQWGVAHFGPLEPQEPLVADEYHDVTEVMDGTAAKTCPTSTSIDAAGCSAILAPAVESVALVCAVQPVTVQQAVLHTKAQSIAAAAQQSNTGPPAPGIKGVDRQQDAVHGQAGGDKSITANVMLPHTENGNVVPKATQVQGQAQPRDEIPVRRGTGNAVLDDLSMLYHGKAAPQQTGQPPNAAPVANPAPKAAPAAVPAPKAAPLTNPETKAAPVSQPIPGSQPQSTLLQAGQAQYSRPQGCNLTAMRQLQNVPLHVPPSYTPIIKAQSPRVVAKRSAENAAMTVNEVEKKQQLQAPSTRRRSTGVNKVLDVKGIEKAWDLNEEDTEEEGSEASFDDNSSSADCDSDADGSESS